MRKQFLLIILSIFTLHSSLFIVKAQQGQWTWMHGSNFTGSAAVWGTQGVFAPGNTPVSIYEAEEWTDKQGYFWLADDFCNLWKYDPTINQWAWIKGPQNTTIYGIYGNLGVAAPANNP